eukprot:CAMPEP_0172154496 /NCGR_PEP_ID=MMETSP1050-20130122/2071_1 /TAXON_ID=233186 /ORGANISM="Cryptomonas curvata, Strain CCAP979/52" /LENGTH=85 /DNA_ID=CAMNT_0012823227 /DNA_START=242 /DNA_END=499 /DNA_ORIENTATION=+
MEQGYYRRRDALPKWWTVDAAFSALISKTGSTCRKKANPSPPDNVGNHMEHDEGQKQGGTGGIKFSKTAEGITRTTMGGSRKLIP